jgi:hypothetical protein
MILIRLFGEVTLPPKHTKIYFERESAVFGVEEYKIVIEDISMFKELNKIKGKTIIANVNPCEIQVFNGSDKETIFYSLESFQIIA